MKIVAWVVGILLLLALAFGVTERLAAERVEVVELHTEDEDGNMVVTRLWVVDHDGFAYLRVGGDGSGWYSRLSDKERNPTIKVTRGDDTRHYQAAPTPSLSNEINRLMQEKYTWGDTFIGKMVGSREGSVPIKLIPLG